MKGIWKWSLSLSLGLLTGALWADEVQWRAAAARPSAPVQQAAPAVPRPLPVSLDMPVVSRPAPRTVVDPNVRPVTFSVPVPGGKAISFRAQSGDGPRITPFSPPVLDEALPMPNRLPATPVATPPGTVVLPYGTVLPPGAVLPPNVVIAPAPTAEPPAETLPTPGASPGSGVAPVPGLPVGPVDPDAPCDQAPAEDCPEGEACCGDPGVCCVEAESCDCCTCCAESCPTCCWDHSRFYVSADYLLWWTKGNPAPPLASTAPIGANGSQVLFGGGDISRQFRSGFRFNAGFWLGESQCLGLDGGMLFLPRVGNSFQSSTPPLVRPFFNIGRGVPDAEFVAFPGVARGGMKIDSDNWLWGADLNLQTRLLCGPWYKLVLLGGFRYLSMEDRLTITENLVTETTIRNTPAGTAFLVQDSFRTRNDFYGGQLGARAELKFGKFIVDLRAKCALGTTVETVEVNGSTVRTLPGGSPQVFRGGLLAQPSNIGTQRQSHFAVVPEGAVNVGYQVTDWWRLYVGYTLLYWSNVVRTGDQIDLRVNGNRLPGSGLPYITSQPPKVPFRTTDFWAQGINFGMEFRF